MRTVLSPAIPQRIIWPYLRAGRVQFLLNFVIFLVLSGFPPKQLLLENKNNSLSSVDIRSGDTLIIEEDKKAPRVSLDSYKKSLSSAALGKMTRK